MESYLSTIHIKLEEVDSRLLGNKWQDSDYSDNVSRIYWIDKGRGAIRHHGCTFVLQPGRLYLIPARTLFSYSCDKSLYQHWIHFTATWPGGLPFFDLLDMKYEVKPENRQQVQFIIERLEKLIRKNGPAAELEQTGIILQLISSFLTNGDNENFARQRKAYLRFQKILEYIDQHLSEPLSISDLAKMAHLERTYFSRTFNKCLHVEPAKYIMRRKIDQAKQILWTTEEPLRQIAISLGFSDEFHFSRSFKRVSGLSPSEFRIMRKKSSGIK